ncbi:MAG: hypothetical protein N4A49_03825 [Marinifilaceae bacterium]|jgi:hypothetical protein|nr:hypothetical protein [Marinifilaceae bacterium]
MIYHFKLSYGEEQEFSCEIKIRENQSFQQLNDLILEELKYDATQMSSFYKLDEYGNRALEIALFELEGEDDDENAMQVISMDVCQIKEFASTKSPDLIFVFDVFSDRFMNLHLEKITEDKSNKFTAILDNIQGEVPQQIDIDNMGLGDIEMPELNMDELKSRANLSNEDIDDPYHLGDDDMFDSGFENLDDYQDLM